MTELKIFFSYSHIFVNTSNNTLITLLDDPIMGDKRDKFAYMHTHKLG